MTMTELKRPTRAELKRPTRAELIKEVQQPIRPWPTDWENPLDAGRALLDGVSSTEEVRRWLIRHPATDPWFPDERVQWRVQLCDLDPRVPCEPNPDWFALYLAGNKQARKEAPLARGFVGYFPNAMINVAHVSFVANQQHNPGQEMHWAFDKSSDEADCVIRHAIDSAGSPFDDDGLLHLAKKAWRAMAELERYLLANYPQAKPGASVRGYNPPLRELERRAVLK